MKPACRQPKTRSLDCTDRAMRIFPVDNALLPLSEQGALSTRTTAAPTTQDPRMSMRRNYDQRQLDLRARCLTKYVIEDSAAAN